jgi:hypothetical protein
MTKTLLYSETIFSDRISRNIIANIGETNMEVVFSHQVAENDMALERSDAPWVYRLRVRICKGLFFLQRFIAPTFVDSSALDDHLRIDAMSWGVSKRNLFLLLIGILSRSRFLRQLVNKIAVKLIPLDAVESYLESKAPVNILFFSLANLKSISVMSLFAKARDMSNVTTFSYIQSWDNPTTKGYGVIRPDYVFTWTELMRTELAEYQDIELCRSAAIGSPTFGKQYAKAKINSSPEQRRKIIFATKSPASFNNNIDIAMFLAAYSKSNGIDLEVRVHPLSLLRKSGELGQLKTLAGKYGFSLRYSKQTNDIPTLESDEDNLVYSSSTNDILITVYSTMNLEAAYLGLDCINIDFEINGNEGKLPRMDMGIDRRQLHNQRLLSYGYIHNVGSFGELGHTLDSLSLQDRGAALARARRLVIENECSPTFSVPKIIKYMDNYRSNNDVD